MGIATGMPQRKTRAVVARFSLKHVLGEEFNFLRYIPLQWPV